MPGNARRVRSMTSSAAGTDGRYRGWSEIAGPANPLLDGVTYRPVIVGRKKWELSVLLTLNIAATLSFVIALLTWFWNFNPEPVLAWAISWIMTVMVISAELLRLLQTIGLCVFAYAAKDPVPIVPAGGLRVALLTTIVPASEPVEMVTQTLRAMLNVTHDGPVDVWILDEGDDPLMRSVAAQLGVKHFSRLGRAEYNTGAGPFRARTKAGNHNAWRSQHGTHYDIVAQVDPDHVPCPDFLQRTLGYFRDPNVAFVVAPQVYGNTTRSFVAHAAAAQGYIFTGIVQRGGNGLGAPLLIGTNHLYRMSAWAQIGGYQDSIIEDHLTSMVVEGKRNPITGARWKGVYTPDIVAVGEGPESWTDFFHQQERWGAGVWQILLSRHSASRVCLTRRQRFAYAFLQSFYPGVGLCWFIGGVATFCYVTDIAQSPLRDDPSWPLYLLWWSAVTTWLVLFSWFRQWYLHPDEQRESVLRACAATIIAAPVYTRAATRALFRRRLAYVVTGKGLLRSQDSLQTFGSHLAWSAALLSALCFSMISGSGQIASRWWALATLSVCLILPAALAARMLKGAAGTRSRPRNRGCRRHIHPPYRRWFRWLRRPNPPAAEGGAESPGNR